MSNQLSNKSDSATLPSLLMTMATSSRKVSAL
jgi:hypothetical protein